MNTMMIDRATVQQAIDALNSSAKTMLSLYGGWRCETTIKKANETATALSEAIEEDEKTTAGHMGRAKLAALLEQGFSVNGVAIARERENGSVERGAVTYGGMVLWWHPEQHARIAALETEAVGYQAELAGYEHTIGHLSALVDELRAQQAAKPAMRGPLTTAEVEQLLARWDYQLHSDRARYLVREAEKIHGINTEQRSKQRMELYGWACTAHFGVFSGEYAQQDAESVARRCGGTSRAFALYRETPTP